MEVRSSICKTDFSEKEESALLQNTLPQRNYAASATTLSACGFVASGRGSPISPPHFSAIKARKSTQRSKYIRYLKSSSPSFLYSDFFTPIPSRSFRTVTDGIVAIVGIFTVGSAIGNGFITFNFSISTHFSQFVPLDSGYCNSLFI